MLTPRRLPALLCFTLSLACGGGSGDDTGGSSTGGGATSDTPTGEPTALDCKSYCATITDHCVSADAQYTSLQQCQGTCAAFEIGDEADRDGNTLGCRVYHADVAASSPEAASMHCAHAGPGGAGQCGSNCEGFCAVAAHACPGTFADDAACMTACSAYADSEPYDAGDVAGNTLACRLYHLTVATEAPDVHCPHILPDSPPCGGAA